MYNKNMNKKIALFLSFFASFCTFSSIIVAPKSIIDSKTSNVLYFVKDTTAVVQAWQVMSGASGEITLNLNKGNYTATIASISNFYGSDITINSTITVDDIQYNIIGIESEAFNGCVNIREKITIPSSITSIGKNAFNGCTNLNQIEVNWTPDQLQNNINIDQNWLGDLNKSTTEIVIRAEYLETYKQKEVDLGYNNCTYLYFTNANNWILGAEGTLYLSSLDSQTKKVVISSVSNFSAVNCNFDTTIEINDDIYTYDYLPDNLFQNNENIKGVLKIDSQLTNIGSLVFDGCLNVIQLNLSWDYNTILNMVGNEGQETISPTWLGSLNNGNTIIQNVDASSTYSLYIQYQDKLGIDQCSWLDDNLNSNLIIPNSEGKCWLEDKTSHINIQQVQIDQPIENPSLNDYLTIGDVKTIISQINFYGFANQTNLYGNMYIPSSIVTIGYYAFDNCNNLNSFTLNWSDTQINEWFNSSTTWDGIDMEWLGNLNNENTIIYVPNGTIEFYEYYSSQLGINNCNIIENTIPPSQNNHLVEIVVPIVTILGLGVILTPLSIDLYKWRRITKKIQ